MKQPKAKKAERGCKDSTWVWYLDYPSAAHLSRYSDRSAVSETLEILKCFCNHFS